MKVRIEISSLASKYQSGVAQYTRLLSEALARTQDVQLYGHYFDFLGRQPQPTLNTNNATLEPNRLIPLRVYAKLQSYGIAPAFDILPPLKKKVDLTIFPNFATWPTIRSCKTATVIHDLTYLYYPESVERKNLAHLRRVVPRAIKRSDFIITVSETVKQEIVKEFDIPEEKCVATPIPPSEEFFSTIAESAITSVKKKYKIPQNKKYIYFIGNLEPRKNLSALIRAYVKLPQAVKDTYHLILAGGKGWKTEETQKVLKNAQSQNENIHHIGFVDQADSPALYQGASLFVMPSLYEGFGIPVLEAMASGIPVVAANIPVLREVGGACALYADTDNPNSFADTIEEALNLTPNKRRLQNQARQFSWEENIQKILTAYKKD